MMKHVSGTCLSFTKPSSAKLAAVTKSSFRNHPPSLQLKNSSSSFHQKITRQRLMPCQNGLHMLCVLTVQQVVRQETT